MIHNVHVYQEMDAITVRCEKNRITPSAYLLDERTGMDRDKHQLLKLITLYH